MRLPVVGAVTIGQSPRDDIVAELLDALGGDARLVQRGVLDDVDRADLDAMHPGPGGEVLVSRMRDGTEVRLERQWLVPRLLQCVKSIEAEVDVIVVLCTDPFPGLIAPKPLFLPGRLLREFVVAVGAQRIGVLTPSQQQIEAQRSRWSDVAPEVVVQAASPYTEGARLENVGLAFADERVQLVVMDCIGYTRAMGDVVSTAAGCPALVAVSTLAHTLRDWLGGAAAER